jgi:hypothetical protein
MTQKSWLLPLKSSSKAEWPDPKLSIGRECCSLGRNRCWEVAGPAQTMSDCLFPKIKGLLESRNEYLNEKEPIPVAIILGFYMIGRVEQKSNPTLLVTCVKKVPRRKALNIIMESGVLSLYPGVLLAESARSPLSLRPAVSLAMDDLEGDFGIYLAPLNYSSNHLNGMRVYIQNKRDGSAASRSATIGGLVYSENEQLERKYYGITVAHVFVPSSPDDQLQPASEDSEEDDIGFAFFGRDSENEEEDEEFIEVTSRGSSIQDPAVPAVLTLQQAVCRCPPHQHRPRNSLLVKSFLC